MQRVCSKIKDKLVLNVLFNLDDERHLNSFRTLFFFCCTIKGAKDSSFHYMSLEYMCGVDITSMDAHNTSPLNIKTFKVQPLELPHNN